MTTDGEGHSRRAQALAAGNAEGKRGEVGEAGRCVVNRANPPSPNLSAQLGVGSQYPSLVSQKIPSQPGSARGPPTACASF